MATALDRLDGTAHPSPCPKRLNHTGLVHESLGARARVMKQRWVAEEVLRLRTTGVNLDSIALIWVRRDAEGPLVGTPETKDQVLLGCNEPAK